MRPRRRLLPRISPRSHRPSACSWSSSNDEITLKSVRNLKYVHVLPVDQLNAYDVLVSDDIVFTKAAYDAFIAAKASAIEEVSA